jgi:hypothetical protein
MFMNRYDIEEAWNRTPEGTNVERGAMVLLRLMKWTDANSDGWPYWSKPSNASKRLQGLVSDWISADRRGDAEDITTAELRAAFTPIKAFLTRQGVNHLEVF